MYAVWSGHHTVGFADLQAIGAKWWCLPHIDLHAARTKLKARGRVSDKAGNDQRETSRDGEFLGAPCGIRHHLFGFSPPPLHEINYEHPLLPITDHRVI